VLLLLLPPVEGEEDEGDGAARGGRLTFRTALTLIGPSMESMDKPMP
jgi:hypothetical protein